MSGASAVGKIGRKIAQSYHLFVGNISWTVSQRELQECFEKFGRVRNARILTDDAGFNRSFGFVTFATRDSYDSALSQPAVRLGGQLLTISPVRKVQRRFPQRRSAAQTDMDGDTTEQLD